MDSVGNDHLQAVPLHQLPVGWEAEVNALVADTPTQWRLLDLGLVPGTKVKVVRTSPLGDPVLYQFRSTTVALRKRDAAAIRVLPIDHPSVYRANRFAKPQWQEETANE